MPTTMIQRICFRTMLLIAICGAAWLPQTPTNGAAVAPASPAAADLAVYADALASGWSDWSWDSAVNLASAAPVHSGSAAISATHAAAWGGLRLHAGSALASGGYSAVRFWVHGGTVGGQSIQFKVITADDQNWSAFAAVTPQAGAWSEVTVALTALGSPPTIGDLVWQDGVGGAQPTFSIDDVTLVGTAAGAYPPLSVDENANVDGFQSSQFAWADRGGQARSAALVKNDRSDPTNHKGGYLRRYTYNLGGSTRVIDGSSAAHPGFGYTTNHFGDGGESATLSHGVQGSWSAVLRGRHHAIHQYKWRLDLGGPVDATVQWLFATGRDNPLWTVTFDSTPAGANAVNADTRAPYGDLQWDGGADSEVAGVGWGDRYKFRSLNSPVTMSSGWDYTQPNTIPYVVEYTVAPDAEMGLVQSQTYLQHDAGGYWFYGNWGAADANGPMPEDYNWTYQLNQYELPFVTTSKRMAWGANFGAVGQTAYPAYGDDRTLVGYPYQSYSVFVVLGKHSLNPVAGQVSEIETVQRTALSASVGSVVMAGPAGIGRPDTVAYAPAGYNQIYSTWNVRAAAGNAATFTFNVAQGALANPIVVVNDYRAIAPPATLLINDAVKAADVDYFASLDGSARQLWITLKGQFSGSSQVELVGPAPPAPALYVPLVGRN